MTENGQIQKKFEPTGMLDTEGEIILNAAEWYSIQAYVEYALQLPTTQADLRRELDVKRDDNWQEFTRLRLDMLDVYKAVNHHCTYWRDTVYPDLVGLADDITGYARTCADSYARLGRLSDEVGNDPETGDETFRTFEELLDVLIEQAERRAGRAADVDKDVHDFCSLMKASSGQLDKAQGEAKAELEALKKDTEGFDQSIAQLREQLDKAKANYARNLAAARSIPAYAWIPIFGWIAGGVVGGVSAAELKKMKDAADKLAAQIAKQDKESQRKHLLMLRYQTASDQLLHLQEDLGGIEPVISKLVGVWRAIVTDLQDVRKTLNEDKTQADALWRTVDFGAVRDSWETVSGKAEFWRKRAFIEVEKAESLAA